MVMVETWNNIYLHYLSYMEYVFQIDELGFI